MLNWHKKWHTVFQRKGFFELRKKCDPICSLKWIWYHMIGNYISYLLVLRTSFMLNPFIKKNWKRTCFKWHLGKLMSYKLVHLNLSNLECSKFDSAEILEKLIWDHIAISIWKYPPPTAPQGPMQICTQLHTHTVCAPVFQ